MKWLLRVDAGRQRRHNRGQHGCCYFVLMKPAPHTTALLQPHCARESLGKTKLVLRAHHLALVTSAALRAREHRALLGIDGRHWTGRFALQAQRLLTLGASWARCFHSEGANIANLYFRTVVSVGCPARIAPGNRRCHRAVPAQRAAFEHACSGEPTTLAKRRGFASSSIGQQPSVGSRLSHVGGHPSGTDSPGLHGGTRC